MGKSTITVKILGDASDVKKTFDSVADGGDKLTSSLGGSFGKIAGLAAGAFAGVQIGDQLFDAAKAAEEASAVAAQTEAVLASTGGAAGVTAAQIDALSSSLSAKAAVDDDLIKSGANVLLTFTNVANAAGEGNDIFDQATATALDMSAALGSDMQSSVTQLGKALNDPIKGITALSKVGVSFTEQQKDQIKALVESGDTLGAQKVILAELNKEFAGSAEAQATPTAKLATVFGELQESLGTALLPALTAFGDIITDLAPVITPIVEVLGTALGEVASSLVAALAPALEAIVPALGTLLTALVPLAEPIGQIVTLMVEALAPIIVTLAEQLQPLVQVLVDALMPILDDLKPIIEDNAEAFVQILEALLPMLPPLLELAASLLPLVTLFAEVNTVVFALITDALTPLITVISEVIGWLAGGLTEAINTIVGWLNNFGASATGFANGLASIWQTIIDGITGAANWVFDRGQAMITFFTDLPTKLSDAAGNLWGWIADGLVYYLNFVSDSLEWLANRVVDALNFVVDQADFLAGPLINLPSIPYINLPELADGGIAYGMTAAIVGEYANARNNPEVIAPLSELRSLLSDMGGGPTEVRVFIGNEEIRDYVADISREEIGNVTRRLVAGRR